jgi:hypothetical protein
MAAGLAELAELAGLAELAELAGLDRRQMGGPIAASLFLQPE